jgi:hypothetical protein
MTDGLELSLEKIIAEIGDYILQSILTRPTIPKVQAKVQWKYLLSVIIFLASIKSDDSER